MFTIQGCSPKRIAKVFIFTLPLQNVVHSTNRNIKLTSLRLFAFDSLISFTFHFFTKLGLCEHCDCNLQTHWNVSISIMQSLNKKDHQGTQDSITLVW